MGEDPRKLESAAGKKRRRGTLRLLGRIVALALAVVLLLDVLPWDAAPMVVPAVSPWVAICSAVALRSFSWIVLLAVPVLVLSVLRKRWFCRYACPVGLLTEQAGRPMVWTRGVAGRLPHLGRWFALIGLAGACVGYPLLLWLDPLAIFSGFFGVWRQPLSLATLLPAIGLPIVLGLSFLLPGVWCLRVCPLGAMQELVAVRRRRRPVSHQDVSSDDRAETSNHRPSFPRRLILALGVGAAWATLALRSLGRGTSGPMRPPGASDEQTFSGLCVRCGNCIRVCPAGILHPDLGDHGVASWLTPVMRFTGDYCREDCHRCTQVCPSGAIARLTLDEKRQTPLGIAQVDMETCVLIDDRECQICKNHCPFEAIRIVWSDATYTNTPVVDPAKCPGCGACEVACITTPVKAIRVVPLKSGS
jgi:MauM/NapG family ferredoxin protein